MVDTISAMAWRTLGFFWASLLTLLIAGSAALHFLGPHAPLVQHLPAAHVETHPPTTAHPSPTPFVTIAPTPPPIPARYIPRAPDAAIPAPDAALLEPGTNLPRISADGRLPRQAYAAGVAPTDQRKRIALLLGDIGLSARDSRAAIDRLPPAISFALAAYAPDRQDLLARLRTTGHELLLALPLEPNGFGVVDAGPAALLSSTAWPDNETRLNRTLSRAAGYVGLVGASGTLRGERFATSAQMPDLQRALASRGLLYVDPRPSGSVVVLDDRSSGGEIEAQLLTLATIAEQRGSALGFATAPTPVMLDRIGSWVGKLAARDIVLVPVSALLF